MISPSTRVRATARAATEPHFARLVFVESPDDGYELVRIADSPEIAKAFAEGFNFAQDFTEGKATTGDTAIQELTERDNTVRD